ncbi:glycosyltransferase involved in cell wall biosynthesis [Bradyrhizobium algeriense]|uniref:Glycosyltransferase involved in cell wall biosynthesis n=1 Tax=Bradyrhizobium algeriense TaxID=634784 RepID=A0ABU8BFT4_9BRAD
MLQVIDQIRPASGSQQTQPAPDRVVIINDVSQVRGGATNVALHSAALLGDSGIPVTYFTGDHGLHSEPRLRNADVVAVGGKHILRTALPRAALDGLYNVSAEQRLAAWIAANDTPGTIYHLHGWSKILSPSVFRALRPVAKRLIVNAHDFFLVCPNGGYFNFRSESPCELRPMSASCLLSSCDRRNYAHKLWRSARQEIRRAVFDFASGARVLAVHEGMLPHLERGGIPRARLATLRNPVTPWCPRRIEAERNKVFLFVGRLEEDKGVDLLLAAARDANVRVRVIGSGPLEGKLAGIYPEVEFTGWKSANDMPALVRDARALVMPSRYREPFGLVAFEALASGLPVVVSSSAMIADELSEVGAGISCDPYDRDAFSKALSILASNNELTASMSDLAYANAARFSLTPSEWAQRLVSYYSDALQEAVA